MVLTQKAASPRKREVSDFWSEASCGEDLYLQNTDRAGYEAHAQIRYQLEPYILQFADFENSRGKRVLEVGVGLGADHLMYAAHGADLYGIDLTMRAIEHCSRRLSVAGLSSGLSVADAENLEFADRTFDIVYSWGVLHHSPDPRRAIAEAHRVLKDGGTARIMLYHKYSMVGFMLWMRYALLMLRPWRSLDYIYATYLESPGTHAYSRAQVRDLFKQFRTVSITTKLSHGDLLSSAAGQRHRGVMLSVARRLWPRKIIERLFPNAGLFMLITATK
jgi:ubiquinone/menaquinone biosynthesis C-methylase UbiE